MKILSMIYSSLQPKQKTILLMVSTLSILGTFMVLLAGVWDSAAHALRVPENFWTIQHITIYTGVTIVALSAILGTLISLKSKRLNREITVILIGTIMQLGGGFADYNFHELYGIDGLVTPSHLTLEFGLFLSAFGGLMIISKLNYGNTRRLVPISIITVLLSAAWICFNLALFLGATILCVPIYELFSSGCAVM